jgi:osmotically-inducible protein OsmY
MNVSRRAVLGGLAGGLVAGPALAQNILLAPKTLIEHAAERRSFSDQAKDNEIVVKVDAVMAKLKSPQAATEIYEQRLLVTGLFDDKPTYDQFEQGVKAIAGIKKLYWHVVYESAADQKTDAKLISWSDSLKLETKAGTNLTVAMKGAEQNYHVCADSYGTLYLIGRALTPAERDQALASVRGTSGAKKVVDYVVVRP